MITLQMRLTNKGKGSMLMSITDTMITEQMEKDRKERPVKVDDPKALAKIAKAHPELGIKLGINNDESDNSSVDKQSESKASFKGKSRFTW